MNTVQHVAEYREYLNSRKSAGDIEINLQNATVRITEELNNPRSPLRQYLANLNEYEKMELLRAIITNDKSAGLSLEISKLLSHSKLPNVRLENLLSLEHERDPNHWFNGLSMQIAEAIFYNNLGEKLDEFSYERVINGAITAISDTTISIPAKRSLLRQLSTVYDSKLLDSSQPMDLIAINKQSDEMAMSDLEYVRQNIKLNKTECAALLLTTLNYFNDNLHLNIQAEIDLIEHHYKTNNFDIAIALTISSLDTRSTSINKSFPDFIKQWKAVIINLDDTMVQNQNIQNTIEGLKKRVYSDINTKFKAVVTNSAFTTNLTTSNQINNIIPPASIEVINDNLKLNTAEFIIISMGVLRNLHGKKPDLDNKIKQIQKYYLAADFLHANLLISDICQNYKDSLDALSPNLQQRLLYLQRNLKLAPKVVSYSAQPSPLTNSKSSGEMSYDDYNIIEKNVLTKKQVLDESQYIMLAVSLLSNISNENTDIKNKLNQIRQCYLSTDFKTANKLIEQICETHRSLIDNISSKELTSLYRLQHTPLSRRLIELQNYTQEVDVLTNYSRRFFENRVAELYLGSEIKLDSINRISHHFIPVNFHPATNVNQGISLLLNDISINPNVDDIIPDLETREDEFKKNSQDWAIRGKKLRENFITRSEENESKVSKEEVFSRNKGAMKSLQPNYRDELSEGELRNANPDIHTTQSTITYPGENPRSALISSISGHAFLQVALLEQYMKDNKDSPTLSDDVNNFLHGLATAFVIKGFHSLREVSDAIATPMVQDLFKQYNVKYDPSFSDRILEQAFNDSQMYTQQILLRTAMHTELLSKKGNLFTLIAKGNFQKIQSILTEGIDVNQKDNQNNSLLHAIIKSDQLNDVQKVELLDSLSKRGASLDIIDNSNYSPLLLAVFTKKINIIIKLLDLGANPNVSINNDNMNIFALGIMRGELKMVMDIIKQKPSLFDPNMDLPDGFTSLTKLILKGKENRETTEFLNALLNHKDINLNKEDDRGNYPLFAAIKVNNKQIIEAILSHPKFDGQKALDVAKDINNLAAVKIIEEKLKQKMQSENSDKVKMEQTKPLESTTVTAHSMDNKQGTQSQGLSKPMPLHQRAQLLKQSSLNTRENVETQSQPSPKH